MKNTLLSTSLALMAFLVISSCSKDEMTLREDDIEEVEETYPEFHPTANWMQKILYDHPDSEVSLNDICIPRSHDAGTYILQGCSFGANACNTKTQHQNTTAQLLDGIRNFDVRPRFWNNIYFTHHMTSCDELGCNGDRIENMLSQVKMFLDEHAELVFFEIGHWCNTDGNDEDFRNLVSSILGDKLYKETEENTIPFIERPLNTIIPSDENSGKAIMLYSGVSNNADNRAAGVFPSSFVPREGSYANAQEFEVMKADQFGKYANFDNDGSEIFEISWTMTQNAELSIACAIPFTNPRSIQDMANQANNNLESSIDELITSGQIVKGRIPNVISVDFCESFVTEECIRISLLNLD